jgi:hypothetical protein
MSAPAFKAVKFAVRCIKFYLAVAGTNNGADAGTLISDEVFPEPDLALKRGPQSCDLESAQSIIR